ncbi:hypothetical protein [Lysobacter gummosus]
MSRRPRREGQVYGPAQVRSRSHSRVDAEQASSWPTIADRAQGLMPR